MKAHNKVIPIDKKGGSQTMQAPLPEPLTHPDVDLRNFRFMPFDVSRFRDSKFSAAVDPAAGFFAIQLWAAAWHQVPAGSLPSDESELRMLAGCGRDTKLWESVRDGAMYKWVLCSDGRYYHPAIAEFVLEAYDKLLINRENGKKGGRPAKAKDDTEKTDRLATANQTLTDRKPREEKRREVKRSESSSSSADASPSAAIVPASPAAAAVSSIDDLELTPDLITWGKQSGITALAERLASFKAKCRDKRYRPGDPTQTFMQACSEDWAKLNGKAGLQGGDASKGGGAIADKAAALAAEKRHRATEIQAEIRGIDELFSAAGIELDPTSQRRRNNLAAELKTLQAELSATATESAQ